jgi:hypothetical protein
MLVHRASSLTQAREEQRARAERAERAADTAAGELAQLRAELAQQRLIAGGSASGSEAGE